ncbi:MAG: bifunctional (p)ppGpp synthetase/guanosine-3',5'-bis(diphosphate) 3'-pyrophosphohydrolase [Clostridiales bacterium]|nr:bifunctional (p)ppGpp synthetase/guanosine-3',5'-bis(diphosphate) 3'-pyrophosphohydrolase [Clostridiales bacterium]
MEKTGIEKLFLTLESTGKNYDKEKIMQAYEYAKALHEGQYRASGEEYISHPLAVAELVAGLELDSDSICAALLHDVVEDCSDKTSIEEIQKRFGGEIALLVDGLTKLVQIKYEDRDDQNMENLRKMFLAMSKDIRVIFIKLCDRLHNMRTLNAKAEEKQRLTALETMNVYAPLAHRLGMQKIKNELENLALSYLDPIGFKEVQTHIEAKFGENIDFVENVRRQISNRLSKEGLNFTLEGRVKNVYSIYRKMFEQNKSFDEIYDFYALRVITQTELECYSVLGIIHEMYNSIPGRFKDYISTPKPNMYQSIHTTVIGRDGVPFEVQIRTWKMHQIAEYGIAAHWKYKTGEQSKEEIDEKLKWIARLIEIEREEIDPEEFMRSLKIDIFHDETFVFTPKGDVVTLPQGSTVIDFAYAIHSEVGNKMTGAKINGMICPIDTIPQNGEIVEIITSGASKGPSRDWLKIVRTAEARNKIRSWFKKEKRSENIDVGRAEIEHEMRRYGCPYTEEQKNQLLTSVAARIGIQSVEDLYNTVGYGGLSMSKLSPRIKDEFDRTIREKASNPEIISVDQVYTKPAGKRSLGGVVIDGVEGCSVKFAKCCNPLPGDAITGFITKGFGVSIHKLDCPNVGRLYNNGENRERFVTAFWQNHGSAASNDSLFEAYLQIYANDSISLVSDISTALADMHIALHQINMQKKEGAMMLNLVISCKNLEHFHSIVSRLKKIPNVNSVVRGFTQ